MASGGGKRLAVFLTIKPSNAGPPWGQDPRNYCKLDVRKMKEALENRGFTTASLPPISTKKKLDAALEKYATHRDDECEFLFIFISSYGIKTQQLLIESRIYDLRHKINELYTGSSGGLINAEKLFFVQGCWKSSDEQHDGLGDTTPAPGAANVGTFWSAFFSTLLGEDAAVNGSPAVAHFCNVLQENPPPAPLRNILTKVQDRLMDDISQAGVEERDYFSNESTSISGIMI